MSLVKESLMEMRTAPNHEGQMAKPEAPHNCPSLLQKIPGGSPVGHGFLPLYDVTCDGFASVCRWFPVDESGVVVNLQHRWLFGSIRHLCDEHTHVPTLEMEQDFLCCWSSWDLL